eukprot:6213068-Pleurochrysis_carterae.AAC.1
MNRRTDEIYARAHGKRAFRRSRDHPSADGNELAHMPKLSIRREASAPGNRAFGRSCAPTRLREREGSYTLCTFSE